MARSKCTFFVDGLDDDSLEFAKQEVNSIVENAQRRGMDPGTALTQYLKQRSIDIKMNKINRLKTVEKLDYAKKHIMQDAFKNDATKGIESLIAVDTGRAYKGNGSIELKRNNLNETASAMILQGMDEVDGGLKKLSSGELDDEIARAWYGDTKVSSDALKLQKTLKKVTDWLYQKKVRAGYTTRYLDNRVVRAGHSRTKLLEMGYDKWETLALETFDLDSMGVVEEKAFLMDLYKKRIEAVPGMDVSDDLTKVVFPVRKKHQAGRVIQYKDADSFTRYYKTMNDNKTYFEGIMREIERDSAQIAAAEMLGPNFDATYSKLKTIANQIDPSFPEKRRKLDALFEQAVRPASTLYGKNMMARYGDKARKLTNMSFLSTSVFSTLPDFALGSGVISSFTGKNALGEFLPLMKTAIANAPRSKRRELAKRMSVFADDLVSGFKLKRFSDTDGGPVSSTFDKMHHAFMVATGLPDQSHILRHAVAKQLSSYMDSIKDVDFNRIYKGTKTVLDKFGVTEDHWKVLKHGIDDFGDETFGMTPEAVRNLSDDELLKIFPDKKKAYVNKLKNEASESLQQVYTYLAERGSPTQSLKTARWKKALDPNTIWGQLGQFAGQFQSFAMSVVESMQFINRNGAETTTFGNLGATASTALIGTMGGYATMVAKDFISGREQKDPMNPHTWKEAAIRGGFGMIYADYIFAERSKAYRPLSADIVGPFIGGPASDLALLFSESTGDIGKVLSGNKPSGKLTKNSLKFLERYTPSLPLVGPMLNYYMFNGINRMLNVKRTESQKKFFDRR